MDRTLKITESDRGVRVRLSNPGQENALTTTAMTQLAQELEKFAERLIPVLVLEGDQDIFSKGRDENEQVSSEVRVECIVDLYRAFCDFPGMTVVLARGHTRGLATGLAACADVCIASPYSSFSFDEIHFGLPAFLAATYVGKHVSSKSLKRLVLTGERIESLEAKALGLVTHVVSDDKVEELLQSLTEPAKVRPEVVRQFKSFVEATRTQVGEEEAASAMMKRY